VRIAFATTTSDLVGDADEDRPLHEEAFAQAGVVLDYCVWSDASIDWAGYDLVVIRSVWDYVSRLPAYRAWLRAIGRLGTLCNPSAVVEWNIDKRYLLELGEAGVPVIPTRVATSEIGLKAILATVDVESVVKPVVSAGSVDTGRFAAGDTRALDLGVKILRAGTPVMVQPSVPSVAAEGEVSAVLFGGEISHCFRKGPILVLGGGVQGGVYQEKVEAEPLSSEQARVVDATIGAVHQVARERLHVSVPLLYQRVDLVRAEDGQHLVLEVELNEPSFFLPVDPEAAERFVGAVARHLEGVTDGSR
jgi:hypothetical protein